MSHKVLRVAFFLFIGTLGACVSYSKSIWGGPGYEDKQLGDGTIYISYRGSTFIGEQGVAQYAIRRAAEIAQAGGVDRFVVVQAILHPSETIGSYVPAQSTYSYERGELVIDTDYSTAEYPTVIPPWCEMRIRLGHDVGLGGQRYSAGEVLSSLQREIPVNFFCRT